MSGQLASAHASSIAVAYHRLANDYVNRLVQSVLNEKSGLDDSRFNTHEKPASIDLIEKENLDIQYPNEAQRKP
jgi:(2Fe-2S) ferredoxin